MSSKFSMPAPSQKPPSVCIKPPPGAQWQFPPWLYEPYQGYVEYSEPFSPTEGSLVGPIAMLPDPPNRTWNGSLQGDDMHLTLEMVADPVTNLLTFTLKWYLGVTLYDTRIVPDVEPRSYSPFDSGEIVSEPPPANGRVAWHILS